MKLKDKTYKKFLEYFENMSKKHDNNEFEIAYSEIQRETGVASITLKKALQVLEEGGVIEVNQGRNTRYGRFRLLISYQDKLNNGVKLEAKGFAGLDNDQIAHHVKNMSNSIELLRQRVRAQEMEISVMLDRLAEIEAKIRD